MHRCWLTDTGRHLQAVLLAAPLWLTELLPVMPTARFRRRLQQTSSPASVCLSVHQVLHVQLPGPAGPSGGASSEGRQRHRASTASSS
jgi:hypothetical protein